ncbi:MAG: TonB-dependent receptor [Pseudomonadota bacterium]
MLRVLLILIFGFALFTAKNAMAQGSVLEEVIVTAQKREQNLQDVGVSVTAFSGESLRDLGYTSSADIAAMTPGLNIGESGAVPLQLSVNIRGVSQNDFGDQNEAPVAIYVDEAYVSWLGALGFSIFDLDRVETLRGPQGTLFGRNATGGLVHYVSRRPTSETEGYVQAEVSENDSYRVEGAVGGSLTHALRGRLSIAYQERGDFQTNNFGPDLGELERTAVRGQLSFDITDSAELLLKAEYTEDDGDGVAWDHRAAIADTPLGTGRFIADSENAWGTCPGCDAYGFRGTDNDDPWDVDNNDPSFIEREINNYAAHLTVELDRITFTSITDYRDVERTYNDDADGSALPVGSFAQNMDGEQFSQEFRLNGKGDRSRWVAGLYYLDISGDYFSDFKVDPTLLELPPGLPASLFIQNNSLDTTSAAVFGQLDYDLSDTLVLTAGLRWTIDDKEYEYESTGLAAGGLVVDSDRGEDDYTYKLQLDWTPGDDLLLYAGVTRGYKAGGFSAPLDGLLTPDQVEYDAEILLSYEVGFKKTLESGLARINGSAFYYDYDDYQGFQFNGLTQQVINLDATIYGGELEVYATPADGLDVLLGLSVLDAEAKDIVMPIGGGVTADRDLPQSPEFSANLMVRKAWELSFGSLALQADVNYQSDYNLNIVNHETTEVDSFTIANVRASVSGESARWTLAVFVNNVTDEDWVNGVFDLSAAETGGATIRAYNQPRWVGASLLYQFGD